MFLECEEIKNNVRSVNFIKKKKRERELLDANNPYTRALGLNSI